MIKPSSSLRILLLSTLFCMINTPFIALTKAMDGGFSLSCTTLQNATNPTSTNGIAEFTLNGGIPPFNFSLTNVQNIFVQGGTVPSAATVQLNNLRAGTYTLTVSDPNETKTCTIIIGLVNCDLGVMLNNSTVNCAGDLGGLSPTISGGIAPLAYAWSNSATTKNLVNVASGTYSLTVTDNAGCTQVKTANIIAPNPLSIFTVPTKATNTTIDDGLVMVNLNGGNSPFALTIVNAQNEVKFLSNNFIGPSDITGLAAGNYIAKVIDNKGCKQEKTFQIGVNNCLFAVSVANTNATCLQSNNQLTAVDNGMGIAPFTYNWSNGKTTATINNISPGTYTVTATDVVGCTNSTSGQVVGGAMLSLNCTVTQHTSKIGLADGEVDINLMGGNPNYSLTLRNLTLNTTNNISISNAGTTSLATLSAGSYSIELTDQINCTANCSFTISEPTCHFNVQLTDVVLPCNAIRGTLQVVASGGVSPYRYKWSNGNMTPTNSNLLPGTYTLSVTDAVDCERIVSARILESFRDEDGDGFFIGCADYSIVPGPDCDDTDSSIFPGASEFCDGKDNNCNNRIDEGLPDTDGDGIADCFDQCPDDPNKTEPGACGCGVYEDNFDYDGDGVIGCKDACPYDFNKIEPGNCGCGQKETADSDFDGVYDCLDECPDNPLKTKRGICGCDAPGITNIQLKNIGNCENQGTLDPSDDLFYADIYIYFDDAPELGALVIKGDIDGYYHFENGNTSKLIVLFDQAFKSNGQSIHFEAVYKGNEDCNYIFESKNAPTSCSQSACDVPTNIKATVVGNTALLSWQPAGNSISYEYKYRAIHQKEWTSQWTNKTSCKLCDLVPNTRYEYQVRALCSNQSSSPYFSSDFTTQTDVVSCLEESNSQECTISEIKVINIRQCHDKGTIYQWDDFFYADLLVYFDEIPTKGFLKIEGNINTSIAVADITNPKVHHFNKLKIFEDNNHLSIHAYFSEQEDCGMEIAYTIPSNPCYAGELFPKGGNKINTYSENNAAAFLTIGPNPTKNYLRVNYHFPHSTEQTQIEVFNLLGQLELVQSTKAGTSQVDLNVEDLDNGLYYLSVSNGGLRITEKFIKEGLK